MNITIIWWAVVVLGAFVSWIVFWFWGRSYERKQHGKVDLHFKQETLRPKPRPTQSIDALEEEGRPHARVSRGRVYPRKGRKRS